MFDQYILFGAFSRNDNTVLLHILYSPRLRFALPFVFIFELWYFEYFFCNIKLGRPDGFYSSRNQLIKTNEKIKWSNFKESTPISYT